MFHVVKIQHILFPLLFRKACAEVFRHGKKHGNLGSAGLHPLLLAFRGSIEILLADLLQHVFKFLPQFLGFFPRLFRYGRVLLGREPGKCQISEAFIEFLQALRLFQRPNQFFVRFQRIQLPICAVRPLAEPAVLFQ